MSTRGFAIVRTGDQWLRCSHASTALDVGGGVVSLAWEDPTAAEDISVAPGVPAGLAFDAQCRLYHSVPSEGRVERLLWATDSLIAPPSKRPQPMDWMVAPVPPTAGDFAPKVTNKTYDVVPGALAIDADDRIFIADSEHGTIFVFDLWGKELIRRIATRSMAHPMRTPVDLAAWGRRVFALLSTPAALWELGARSGPVAVPLPESIASPLRLAVGPAGEIWVLEGGATPRVIPLADPEAAFEVPGATDLLVDGEGRIVVARGPGQAFRRFVIEGGTREEAIPLFAPGYDGGGIVLAPDGAIGFWSAQGYNVAFPARVRYAASGQVTTFRLDSGAYRTTWGRLFADACVPKDTEVRVFAVASDDPPEGTALAWGLPANTPSVSVHRPDLTPPLPPVALLPDELSATDVQVRDGLLSPVHRRETGRELAWSPLGADDSFDTYEAPLFVRGRYLWVTLELRGSTRRSPRIRGVRAERPAHDLLDRLPRAFSRAPEAESFLYRMLAPLEGSLAELDARSTLRHALVDAASTPADALPWLATFAGLTLDPRWPVERQRELVSEIIQLWRFRGTVKGLRRFIELYTRTPVHIIEHFKLRGYGGPVLGSASDDAPSRSVLGSGFRVGGSIGTDSPSTVGGDASGLSPFATRAHRFTVIVSAALTAEQRDAVAFIVESHKPAHTAFDLCTVESGMRVGLGLMVGLTSAVGRTGGFRSAQLGAWVLGRNAVVGRPRGGTVVTGSRLGYDSTVG